MRIGIDVGGTHTDAVIMNGKEIMAAHKALTSSDVRQGIIDALDAVMGNTGLPASAVEAVMIGTTHFTNAVIQRRELAKTAIIRACLPTGSAIPPMTDWPQDIATALGEHVYMVEGGHTFDGLEIRELDIAAVDNALREIKSLGINSLAISAAFSPADPSHEQRIADRARELLPDANITLSHEIGRLGILERENAALLNAALGDLAQRVVASMREALAQRQLRCPFFVSQNDGTLMSAEYIAQYPALTFSSGPTNSLRGAAALSGIEDAIVVDIGGTTSDVGVLAGGFPRESNSHIDVGGVRTNFRMPDITAIGVGGGSIVSPDGSTVGPQSVGHKLVSKGLVFGGSTLTATDIVVAASDDPELQNIGDPSRVAALDAAVVSSAVASIHRQIDDAIDRMRPSSEPVPVVLVGGGSILINQQLQTASRIICPPNAGVANAIGAALAQVGGEIEQIVSYSQIAREEAISQLSEQARKKAIAAGAEVESLRILDIEENPMSYMDDNAVRLRIKVVGDLAFAASPAAEDHGATQ